MCGIVGVVGVKNLSVQDEGWFKDALYIDALRGQHSTGVVNLSGQLEKRMVKKAMQPYDFLSLNQTASLFRTTNRMFLGHNRHATKGAVNNVNAHPFEHGHITMVHNGSLFTWKELEGGDTFTVDSEAICHSLAVAGVEETVKKLNGAYSLVWWDDNDKTLNFVRNNDRPMYVSVSQDNERMFFASEPEMITWLTDRSTYDFKLVEPKHTVPGIHYKWDIGYNNNALDKKLSFTEKRLKMYKPRVISTRYPHQGNNNNGNLKNSLDTLGLAVNTKVSFWITETKKSSNTSDMLTIKGFMAEDPWLPITAYQVPSSLNPAVDIEYKALPANMYGKGKDATIILNGSSIEETDFMEELAEFNEQEIIQLYKVYRDERVTSHEFNKRVKGGCSNCSANIFPISHEKVGWVDKDSPLCPSCSDDWIAGKLNLTH